MSAPMERHPMRELQAVIGEDNRLERTRMAEAWCETWLTQARVTVQHRPKPLLFVPGSMPSEAEQRERTAALQQLSIEIALRCTMQMPGKVPGSTELIVVALRSTPNGT